MNQQEAYDQGKANGYGAAIHTTHDDAHQSALELFDHGSDTQEEWEEALYHAAHEGEQQAREYSGFASFAAEINNGPESRFEGLWEKYEEGVTVGINKGVKELLKGERQNPRKLRKRIPKRIEIAGNRWMDSFGNTYHVTRIYFNDKLAYESPEKYGYDDHYYNSTAKKWLVENGYLPPGEPVWYLRDHNGVDLTNHATDVSRKRDL